MRIQEEECDGGGLGSVVECCIDSGRLCSVDERMRLIEEEERKKRKEARDNMNLITSGPSSAAPAGYIESS